MSEEPLKNMSALDVFNLHRETLEEAKKKSSEENGNRATYLRFSQDGTRTVRILPLAPVIDPEGNVTMERKGYEYPIKELVLKIESDRKDANGNAKASFVSVCNAKYVFKNLDEDLIDTYVRTACEVYGDDETLCKKLKESSFNGGLKWDSKRCMYVYDLDKRGDGLQILQLSYSQYKELEDRKLKLWSKLAKNGKAPCPISSPDGAYALEVTRKTEKKKTEYSINIDTVSGVDVLTEEELQSLLDAPRLPEVLYRYSRFHLEATIAFLNQTDEKYGISVMGRNAVKDCIDRIKMLLPADDHSHFTLGGNSSGDAGRNSPENRLDALWDMLKSVEDKGFDDRSEEGQDLRESIKEYIEQNELNIRLGRSKTNEDLLREIEDVLSESVGNDADGDGEDGDAPETEPNPEQAGGDGDEDDGEPSDAVPDARAERNDDTSEPASRPDRRAARPARRR